MTRERINDCSGRIFENELGFNMFYGYIMAIYQFGHGQTISMEATNTAEDQSFKKTSA